MRPLESFDNAFGGIYQKVRLDLSLNIWNLIEDKIKWSTWNEVDHHFYEINAQLRNDIGVKYEIRI